jgi:hypothetical protein
VFCLWPRQGDVFPMGLKPDCSTRSVAVKANRGGQMLPRCRVYFAYAPRRGGLAECCIDIWSFASKVSFGTDCCSCA